MLRTLILALTLLTACESPPSGELTPTPQTSPAASPAEASTDPETRSAAASEAPSDLEAEACRQACREGIKETYLGCIEAGGEHLACRTEVGLQVRACKEERCPDQVRSEVDRTPDPCKLDCRLDARERFTRCTDEGRDDESCRSEAKEEAESCAAACEE